MAMEKEMRMIETKGGELCKELLEEIFLRVPLKPMTRMKCISKDWCRLISNLPKVSDFVFILVDKLYDEELYECKTNISLFGVKDKGSGELEYHEYNALGSTLEGYIERFCYSNGLLLFYNDHSMLPGPFIYDMILKRPIFLPSMSNLCAGSGIGMGLAYDGVQTRVVCFFFNRDVEFLDCLIFSSETGEWKKHRSKVFNYSRLDNYFMKNINRSAYSYISKPQCLFHDGLMYWTVYGYLIVYNLQENFFEFHDLMRKGLFDGEDTIIRNRLDECMWVSGGCLHYCYIDKDSICVWKRFKGEEVDYNDEYYQDEFTVQLHYLLEHHRDWWCQEDKIHLQTLATQHPEFFGKVWERNDGIRFLKPCPFNEDLQLLYLQLPGSLIVSYSFETKCLKKVYERES